MVSQRYALQNVQIWRDRFTCEVAIFLILVSNVTFSSLSYLVSLSCFSFSLVLVSGNLHIFITFLSNCIMVKKLRLGDLSSLYLATANMNIRVCYIPVRIVFLLRIMFGDVVFTVIAVYFCVLLLLVFFLC